MSTFPLWRRAAGYTLGPGRLLVPRLGQMVEAVGRLSELERQDCRLAVEGYFSTRRMVAEHIELFESMAR